MIVHQIRASANITIHHIHVCEMNIDWCIKFTNVSNHFFAEYTFWCIIIFRLALGRFSVVLH